MATSEGLLVDLAGAILDGSPIDWASAAEHADEPTARCSISCRLLAAVAEVIASRR